MLDIANLKFMLKRKNTSNYILNKQINVLNNYFISKTNTSNQYLLYNKKQNVMF